MYKKYAEIRDARGLTDYRIAQAANVPMSTLYDWRTRSQDNPGAKINIEHAAAIARVLGVTIEAFLEG